MRSPTSALITGFELAGPSAEHQLPDSPDLALSPGGRQDGRVRPLRWRRQEPGPRAVLRHLPCLSPQRQRRYCPAADQREGPFLLRPQDQRRTVGAVLSGIDHNAYRKPGQFMPFYGADILVNRDIRDERRRNQLIQGAKATPTSAARAHRSVRAYQRACQGSSGTTSACGSGFPPRRENRPSVATGVKEEGGHHPRRDPHEGDLR